MADYLVADRAAPVLLASSPCLPSDDDHSGILLLGYAEDGLRRTVLNQNGTVPDTGYTQRHTDLVEHAPRPGEQRRHRLVDRIVRVAAKPPVLPKHVHKFCSMDDDYFCVDFSGQGSYESDGSRSTARPIDAHDDWTAPHGHPPFRRGECLLSQ
jgi:hypothetical protein